MTSKTDQLPTLDDADLATTCGGIRGILGYISDRNSYSTECKKARDTAKYLHSSDQGLRAGAEYNRQNCLAMKRAHGGGFW
jgi:hypothetical protein